MTQQSNPYVPLRAASASGAASADSTFQMQPDVQLPPINTLLHTDGQIFPSNILQLQPDPRMSLSNVLQSQPDSQMSQIFSPLSLPDPQTYVRAELPQSGPVANEANPSVSVRNLDTPCLVLAELQKHLLETAPSLPRNARRFDGGLHHWRLSPNQSGRAGLGPGSRKLYSRNSLVLAALMTLKDYRKTTNKVLEMLREVCIKSTACGPQDMDQVVQQIEVIITWVEGVLQFHGTVRYPPPLLPLDSTEHEENEQ
jgi:hypothetical protein